MLRRAESLMTSTAYIPDLPTVQQSAIPNGGDVWACSTREAVVGAASACLPSRWECWVCLRTSSSRTKEDLPTYWDPTNPPGPGAGPGGVRSCNRAKLIEPANNS